MKGITHIIVGACAALAFAAPAEGIILAGVGGVLPDIDCISSLLGRKVAPVAKKLKHRSFTHSLIFATMAIVFNKWIALGVLTHLLLDMATGRGITLLWPYHKKIRLPLAKYNKNDSHFEKLFRTVVILIALVVCVRNTGVGVARLLEVLTNSLRQITSSIL